MLIARTSSAVEISPSLSDASNDGKIDVVYAARQDEAYRDRRGKWATYFAINVDQIYPNKFRSRIDNASYDEEFDSLPIPLLQFEVAQKYNLGIGGVGVSAMAGHGEVTDYRRAERALNLTKYGLGLLYVMDVLFPEPYLAPYFSAQLLRFRWDEAGSKTEGSVSGETSESTAITFGALIQLNSLDPDSSLYARNSSGLENTYLDLFVSVYNPSDSSKDPNFQTDINFGAGLRFEF